MSAYEACCACGGGELCATAIGGVIDQNDQQKKCGCKNQCTDSLTFSGRVSQETLTASLDTDWGVSSQGWFDPIYMWSDCFWIVQTNGPESWLDLNITNIPDAHFVEVSSCHRDGKTCCFPETFGQSLEGSKMVIRMANPPTFLRLDLKTYNDVEESDSSGDLVMQVQSYTQNEPPAVCGDSLPSGTETCDDGNMESGDGCSSECTIEENWLCKGDLAVDIVIEIDENTQQTVNVRGGPMFCKQMCTTDDPVIF